MDRTQTPGPIANNPHVALLQIVTLKTLGFLLPFKGHESAEKLLYSYQSPSPLTVTGKQQSPSSSLPGLRSSYGACHLSA